MSDVRLEAIERDINHSGVRVKEVAGVIVEPRNTIFITLVFLDFEEG